MENEERFRQWVDAYSDALYRYAWPRLREEELCKDMVQETFLAAWRNFDNYKSETSVKNWLFLILKNKIIDHYRKSSARAAVERIPIEQEEHLYFDEKEHWRKGAYPQNWSVDFSNQTEAKDFQKQFLGCSKKLKELQNTVFVMKYVDDRSSEEICALLGITAANYWVLLHRAKLQLRACLEKNWMLK
jgi:RNA polymerase sigma-70 factor (ECF subfamily)